MKIVNVIGGIGNQMFCYAFALALEENDNQKVLIDISHYNQYNLHNGFQINGIFNNAHLNTATKEDLKQVTRYIPNYKISRIIRRILPPLSTEYIEQRDYVYDENALKLKGNKYYEGYWQSPAYFLDLRDKIINEFEFPTPNEINNDFKRKILNSNSVGIHIRRGDYLNAKSFKGICELDYYTKAIKYIKRMTDNPYFYIFSNDINWCNTNIIPILETKQVQLVSHNTGVNSFWDIYLMSSCRNLIIANSSFSWWSAFLNIHDSPIIIAPNKWVNRNYCTNIHLNEWIKI